MASNESFMCPLCRNEKVKIFAVGECSHPVCYLCSTKMRILCEQTYCAICRQELPRVYFVSKIADTQPTIDQSRFMPIDETGDCGIYYPVKTDWVRRETETLLRNFCPFCHVEYESFEILRDHVRRTHRYFYCDLCVENLNLFPYERKCYTRHDLVQHIRCGDPDDTSFKGHPICQFCDDHFIDDDELYKHMRKEHYYCHLCTSDNVYYSDFDLLRDHYRKNHYLCEMDQCKDVQFTNVFASDFEFRAHQAAQHGKTRAQVKQLGTIPVEFQSSSTRDQRQRQDPPHRGTFKSGKFNTQETNNSSENEREATQQEPAVAVAVPSIDEFPTLNVRPSTPQNVSYQRGAWSNDPRGIHSSADFPALASAANNAPNTSTGQPKGIWREQQQQQQTVASITQNATSKKASQPAKPLTNGAASMNMKEDFPALKGATNAKIPAPVSMFSAWSTAKKTAKNASASAKGNQPQMRMNTSRLVRDEEDEEYIRRPMSSLMTSTTPMASSNITMISSSDVSGAQVNEKPSTSKNQSLPNAHDFPALPSTNTTSNYTASGAWTAAGTNTSGKLSTTQQKKKSGATSKKKFMEEVHAMPPPPTLSSTDDYPAFGLSELGRRLITDEDEPAVTTQVKKEKPQPSPAIKQEKKEENKPTIQSNKKAQKTTKTSDSITQEPTPAKKDVTPVKPVANQASSQSLVQNESVSQPAPSPVSSTQPPPGFTAPLSVPPPPSPPPGFNSIPSSQPTPPSYIYSSTYSKQKDEFHAKLFTLFDGDMDLFVQYDQFCEAFSQNKITSKDFIKFTTELFKDKLEEYLLELIVIIPNIEQQNELYSIWEKDIRPLSISATTPNANNWSKKNSEQNNVHKCRICQQIMFETDTDEHNSYHTEFNTQFPSLPSAAVPFGRGGGKKKK